MSKALFEEGSYRLHILANLGFGRFFRDVMLLKISKDLSPSEGKDVQQKRSNYQKKKDAQEKITNWIKIDHKQMEMR